MLELGGSRPVRRDAVGRPGDGGRGRGRPRACQNNGQSCIAAKRFIVHTDVVRRVRRPVRRRRWRRCVVGDPMDEATDVGPLATEQGREDVEELVTGRRRQGRRGSRRRHASGGRRLVLPAHRGHRHHPEMRMYLEEVFGPVAQALPRRGHRGGDRDRQRDPLRARLQRLDQRRRTSRSASSATWRPGRRSSTG